MPLSSQPDPCVIVIFGASGDLTKRKLIPALYDLFVGKQMPERFAVLGISRSAIPDDDFRERLEGFAKQFAHTFNDDTWRDFAQRIYYHAADSTKAEAYPGIRNRMAELAKEYDTGENALLYLSMAPHLYEPTIIQIGAHEMITEGKSWCSIDRNERSWQRIVVEKPFGHDLETAGPT